MPLLSRPRGCRIDDEFMPARARHREIGGPFALEDAVDIDAGLAPLVRWAHAVLINPPATLRMLVNGMRQGHEETGITSRRHSKEN